MHKPGFVMTVIYNEFTELYSWDLKYNDPTFFDPNASWHMYDTTSHNPLNSWNPENLPSGLFKDSNYDSSWSWSHS